MAQAGSGKQLLAQKIDVLCQAKQDVIYVKTTDSIPTTLQTLFKNKILSVPIYDEATKQFVCIVDLLDFVTHIFYTAVENEMIERSIERVMQIESKYTSVEAANESKRNPWKPVDKDISIADLIAHFVKNQVHRTAVTSGSELLRIVSQSDIVEYLHEHMDAFKHITGETIANTNIGADSVFTLHESDRALDGFKVMHKQHVSAVAVINNEGHLVSCLSNSDLREVGANLQNIWDLFLTIKEYKNKLGARTPIVVSPNDTLASLLKTFVTEKTHRVYVVKDDKKPIRVISLTDVIQHFASNCS